MALGHPGQGDLASPPSHLCFPPGGQSLGASDSCLSPSPGPPSLTASSPHAPGILCCCRDASSRLSGVPGLQFTSSGAGDGRGEELRPARPHLPSQTQEGRVRSRSPPSGGLAMEWSARLPAGCGGQGVGLKSFTYRHVRHWEFRGQGSPGPLPQYEGKPSCEREHPALLALAPQLAFFLWEPRAPWPPDPRRPSTPRIMLVPMGRRGRALWTKVTGWGDGTCPSSGQSPGKCVI